MKKINIIASLSLPLVFVFGMSACHEQKEAENHAEKQEGSIHLSKSQGETIAVDTAKSVGEESELLLTGKISFDEDKVAKVYPLVSGTVMKVNVSMGDYVKRGDLLAVFKSADISGFQNQYQVALSNLNVAKKTRDIAEELYRTNVNSEKDFLNAQNEYRKAEAEADRLKEQLLIFGANENATDAEYKVRAPIEGYVVEKNINENMEVRSDNATNIFTVSSLKTVWVLASVYESDVSKVAEGSEAEITTIAYPDKIFKGRIQRIGNLFDASSKTLRVRIVLENTEGLLKPEMFAKVKVKVVKPNKVISIPTSSLVFDEGSFYVMVKKGEDDYKKTAIRLIKTTDRYSFVEGVQEKDVVATNGALYILNKLD